MAQLHDYDKILTRLTIILQRLYEGEELSVTDLAEEFNVSSKTIQRDFNERLIRFPIEKQGRRWKMQSGHQLTKERSPEEMLVLEMLGNIAQSIGTGFGSKAQSLFSKLQNETNNPIHSKTIIEDISDNAAQFHQFERAIAGTHVVTFDYKGKTRRVNPYKITSFEGYWYLYGAELPEQKLKTYYFKEIRSLEILDETFKPDERVYKVLEQAVNAWFEPNREPFEVVLNASPEIAKYFKRRPLASTQRIEKVYEDGSMDIVILATSDREILHEVKKWMPDLVIVDPEPLAQKGKDVAETYLNRQKGQLED
jgi:predicted DNA-binding transcriptional regulator YafY